MLRKVLFIAVFAAIVAFAVASTRETPEDLLDAEFVRIEKLITRLESAKLPDELKGSTSQLRDQLAKAKAAKSFSYRLYRLRDPFVGAETLAFVSEHRAEGDSLAAFESLWRAASPNANSQAKPSGTFVRRALVESSDTRSERLHAASLPYAKADSPAAGVYYLGQSEGNRKFGEFVRSLSAAPRNGGPDEKSPTAARVTAAIGAIERETLAIFGADVTTQQLVPVSVRMKEARELLAAGHVDGAALLAVEARLSLLRRGGSRASWPATHTPLPGSVEQLFRAWAGDEYAPMAASIDADIVPFFRSLYVAAPPVEQKPAQVNVTLVRWPYT